jgi:L-alanine-DL-glutamate epimerase-like enolase superfamily enzyme
MQRKHFLRTALTAAAVGTLPGSVFGAPRFQVDTICQRPDFNPSLDVKITAVKVFPLKNAMYVKIETDAGVSGWGEGDHDHTPIVSKAVQEVCAPVLLGQSPWMSEMLFQKILFESEDLGSTGLLLGALAGVDNALWDLKGRLAGLPVWAMLGGFQTDKIRLYGSFGRTKTGGFKSPDEMAITASEFVAQGYTAVKARMQIRLLNVDPDPDPTYDVVRAVRKAIGDDVKLFVDFNNGYTPARAIALARKLYEHFNIAIVEEPVTYHNYHDLAQVVEAIDIPVGAGEHEFNRWQMRELITEGRVDIVNTDIIKAGGISENRRIAALAAAFDRRIMAHNTRPTLASAATLHLLASLPNTERWQESSGSRPDMGLHQFFHNQLKFENGHLFVPQTPGLGLEVDEPALLKFLKK